MIFDMGFLHDQIAAVCPILVLSVGDPNNKATWSVAYDPSATTAQQQAAQSVIAGWNSSSINPMTTFAQALAAGVAITSASTAALSGAYGCAAQDEINVTGLQASILAGQTWLGYLRDTSGVPRQMTAAQFTTIADAILQYIASLDAWLVAALGGTVNALPSNQLSVP